MERIYNGNSEGISTKINCPQNGKKYLISSAQDPRGPWQLAIFEVLIDIPSIRLEVDLNKPYVGPISKTFKDAEMIHFKVEKMVQNSSPEAWLFTMHNW